MGIANGRIPTNLGVIEADKNNNQIKRAFLLNMM
jgi:hypothetical protein